MPLGEKFVDENLFLIHYNMFQKPWKYKDLPYEVEHIYPDYSLYPKLTKDRAYGFLTRGCPNNCSFCIVAPYSEIGTVIFCPI